jgi:hypothetical protein
MYNRVNDLGALLDITFYFNGKFNYVYFRTLKFLGLIHFVENNLSSLDSFEVHLLLESGQRLSTPR